MVDPDGERLGKQVRTHVRIEVQLEASIIVAGEEGDTVYSGITKNLSLGGVCLQIYENKEEIVERIGETLPEIGLSLYLISDGDAIDVNARTAWIHSKVGWLYRPSSRDAPILMGLEFEDLTEGDAEKINNFIVDVHFKDRESVIEQEMRILDMIHHKTEDPP